MTKEAQSDIPGYNMPRFSEFFGLDLSQAELDFVDIPLETDIRVFCDPFAIMVDGSPWLQECNEIVVGFFERLIQLIQAKDAELALRMLEHVGEANEAHMGFSRGMPRGLGIGPEKARRLYNNLLKSRAVATGRIQDIAEVDLFVRDVDRDNISDMTINILRGELIRYTQEQCLKLDVPLRRVAAGFTWDAGNNRWVNRYAELPVAGQYGKILLIPKTTVRYGMTINPSAFYNDYALEFLKAEHLDGNTSLVTVLKNGSKRVYKTDLKDEYPFSKEYLQEFADEHPEILEKYKEEAAESNYPLSDEQIELKQPDPKEIDRDFIAQKLANIPTGTESATLYHRTISGILEAIFSPTLRYFKLEEEIHEGRKRIDIVAQNGGLGFFGDLLNLMHMPSRFIPIECKNYGREVGNPEADQLAGRFSPDRGKVGLFICRSFENRALFIRRCRDAFTDDRGVMIALTDEDLIQLLQYKSEKNERAIKRFMTDRLREVMGFEG